MRQAPLLIGLLAALAAAPPPVHAQADPGAATPEGAIACVAARYRGEALSVRWEEDDDDRDARWELRWLTPARNVLRVEVAPPGCRFIEVRGVGQEQARIAP